ncbi:hypothetical protein [uncultured Nevskia sp.]|uniref:hypothetical protein n=1 Tax=uncultured Nevskia sp. TaxID=228950 RepID=UPI0025F0D68B|nr:hypothetical protein [uncultured Nevskia sp.]
MSITNRAKDRDAAGRLRRSFRRPNHTQSTPGYWVRLHMNRPRRHENRHMCWQVMRGRDPDGLIWPLGSRKPHVYYW